MIEVYLWGRRHDDAARIQRIANEIGAPVEFAVLQQWTIATTGPGGAWLEDILDYGAEGTALTEDQFPLVLLQRTEQLRKLIWNAGADADLVTLQHNVAPVKTDVFDVALSAELVAATQLPGEQFFPRLAALLRLPDSAAQAIDTAVAQPASTWLPLRGVVVVQPEAGKAERAKFRWPWRR